MEHGKRQIKKPHSRNCIVLGIVYAGRDENLRRPPGAALSQMKRRELSPRVCDDDDDNNNNNNNDDRDNTKEGRRERIINFPNSILLLKRTNTRNIVNGTADTVRVRVLCTAPTGMHTENVVRVCDKKCTVPHYRLIDDWVRPPRPPPTPPIQIVSPARPRRSGSTSTSIGRPVVWAPLHVAGGRWVAKPFVARITLSRRGLRDRSNNKFE